MSNSKSSIDERYAFGSDGSPPPPGTCKEFYTLKEQAKGKLATQQLAYLFEPVTDINHDNWWDLKSEYYIYKYDNFGFRNIPELESLEQMTPKIWKNTFVCIGCSWTFGVGIPGHCTWPAVLQQQIGTRCLNLGVAGGGIQTTYRILNAWIKHFGCKPKGVLILGWFTPRLETAYTDLDAYRIDCAGNPYEPKIAQELINEGNTHAVYTAFRKKFAELKEEYDLDVYRINPSVISLQYSYTEPIYADLQFFIGEDAKFLPLKGFGYDLSHPGPAIHRHLANIFKKMIETGDKFLI